MSKIGRERGFELLGRRLVQHPEQLDEIRPRFRIVLRLDLVQSACRRRTSSPRYSMPAAATGTSGHLPARALRALEVVAREVRVELLRVHVHAPALAVDHDAHVVRLRRRDVLPGDLGVEDRPHERRVAVRVEQVERAVAAEHLLLVDEVERQVQRALRPLGHHHVRRRAAEVDADVLVGLAVDRRDRRHLDVGVVEGGELLLPVGVLELQEERPERAEVVERARSDRT